MKRAKLPSCYPMLGCHHLRRVGPVGVMDAKGNQTIEEGPLALAVCPACNDWWVAYQLQSFAPGFSSGGAVGQPKS